jgi:hypothetical protein
MKRYVKYEKGRLNCEKIWIIWKKSKLNSDKIWKNMEEGQVKL